MSYYKAIGKLVDESGMPYILVESGLLAPGSLNGFIGGKNFNRCKRLHSLISAALQTLHFQAFLKTQDSTVSKQEIIEYLRLVDCDGGNVSSFINSLPLEIYELQLKYEKYSQLTLLGEHGPTAQFWMIYMRMMDVQRKVTRAVRMQDHRLYIEFLPQVIKVFFVFNHQNYARWLTR